MDTPAISTTMCVFGDAVAPAKPAHNKLDAADCHSSPNITPGLAVLCGVTAPVECCLSAAVSLRF